MDLPHSPDESALADRLDSRRAGRRRARTVTAGVALVGSRAPSP